MEPCNINMSGKQKTFRLDSRIADYFAAWCDAKMLKQQGVIEASLLLLTQFPAETRERIFAAVDHWKNDPAADISALCEQLTKLSRTSRKPPKKGAKG